MVDLLEYDVRFGQGFLFSPPRPVRAEALQGAARSRRTAATHDAPTTERRRTASHAGSAGLTQLVTR